MHQSTGGQPSHDFSPEITVGDEGKSGNEN
jgi:hypothetical protein